MVSPGLMVARMDAWCVMAVVRVGSGFFPGEVPIKADAGMLMCRGIFLLGGRGG